ncbi:hypothetical protein NMY22_g4675 [Coprinellus aureogranulatus]|nr:hypothetical protein NMY22_g4675 [Coprinellus aureogranulatus]
MSHLSVSPNVESMSPLVSLPPELEILIYEQQNPCDLIVLSQTCKALRGQRQLWKTALKGVCVAHSIFEPTYPTESMSIEDLRRAATGPQRRYDRIMNSTVPWRTATTSISLKSGTIIQLEGVHLVSGGRYFFASAKNAVTLWDLGAPGLKRLEQRPQVLETLHFKEDSRISCISTPVIHDRRCLRFAVVLFDDPNRPTARHPLLSTARRDGRHQGLLSHPENPMWFRSGHSCMGLQAIASLFVEVWLCPLRLVAEAPECVVISGAYILIGTHKIISWKIPPLQPLERASLITADLQQVLLSSPTVHDRPHDQHFVHLIGRYGSVMVNFIQPTVATADGSRVRGWLDVFYCVSDIPGNKKFARFYLDVAVDKSSGDVTPQLTLVTSLDNSDATRRTPIIPADIDTTTMPELPGQATMTQSFWGSHLSAIVTLFAVDPSEAGRGRWVHHQVEPPEAAGINFHSASCPVSGRVVYHTAGKAGYVRILDVNP